jgi:tripartite-type tricarboxylate transporter receptor subunit TctC
MRKNRRIKDWFFMCVFFLFLIPTLVFAQEFPTKPINILMSFTPGQSVDVSIRMLANTAQKFLGQPFIVSNNGGGGGSVALGIVAKEKPDGYHLVGCASTGLILIPQFRTVPYKLDDFIPIMHYGAPQTGLVVRADSPWKTLKEFIDYAKKNPGKVTYSTTGAGTPPHLAMENIGKVEGGIQWTMIPYTGGTPDVPLLGGHVTACSGGASWLPQVRAGSLRILATYGEKRMKSYPDVPTLKDLGYDIVTPVVFMLAAPKGTPSPVIKKLDEAFRKAMDDPEFVRYLESMEIDVSYRNHENTKKYLEEAYSCLGKLVMELKIPKEPEKEK